jgi:branched-chain amino acid transport system substrate-binding protein
MLLSSALPTIKGKTGDKEALTTAIENAKFKSIRGNFKFNKNHMPIQDWALRTVVRDDTGRITNRTVDRIVAGHLDSYGQNCNMTAAK